MGFTLANLIKLRPYLYHLTYAQNLQRIRENACLETAHTLFQAAGLPGHVSRERRKTKTETQIGQERVGIRDQAPLHKGNVRLLGGWTFEDLLFALNNKIFFWPGSITGPIAYGIRHFERYESEGPVILKIPTQTLICTNNSHHPKFCKYNSGAPRCTKGLGSPRGPNTFIAANVAPFRASAVIEVTFDNSVNLPPTTQVGLSPSGPWTSFFEGGNEALIH